jgi:hypothetical protein
MIPEEIWTFINTAGRKSKPANELFIFSFYISGDQIKKDEMGRVRSANGGEKSCIQGFGKKTREKQTTWNTRE